MVAVLSYTRPFYVCFCLSLCGWNHRSLRCSHRPKSGLLAPSLPATLLPGLPRLKIPAICSANFSSAVVHRAEKAGKSPQEGKVDFLEDLTLTKLAGVARIGHTSKDSGCLLLSRLADCPDAAVRVGQERLAMRTLVRFVHRWDSWQWNGDCMGRFSFMCAPVIWDGFCILTSASHWPQRDNIAGNHLRKRMLLVV